MGSTLRGGQLGVAFKRQVPLVGRYIADLFAPAVGLVVEIDGGYHQRRDALDDKRDRALARAGYRVLRIEADAVLTDLPAVVARIREAIADAGRGR